MMKDTLAEEPTILAVDDTEDNLDLLEFVMKRKPVKFLRAKSGRECLALAREKNPDVILLDINLPGISGLQALKILQEDPITRHIPVLALSANAMPRDIERGLAAGFCRYLTKPIRVTEFMQALDVALEQAQQTTERDKACVDVN